MLEVGTREMVPVRRPKYRMASLVTALVGAAATVLTVVVPAGAEGDFRWCGGAGTVSSVGVLATNCARGRSVARQWLRRSARGGCTYACSVGGFRCEAAVLQPDGTYDILCSRRRTAALEITVRSVPPRSKRCGDHSSPGGTLAFDVHIDRAYGLTGLCAASNRTIDLYFRVFVLPHRKVIADGSVCFTDVASDPPAEVFRVHCHQRRFPHGVVRFSFGI